MRNVLLAWWITDSIRATSGPLCTTADFRDGALLKPPTFIQSDYGIRGDMRCPAAHLFDDEYF